MDPANKNLLYSSAKKNKSYKQYYQLVEESKQLETSIKEISASIKEKERDKANLQEVFSFIEAVKEDLILSQGYTKDLWLLLDKEISREGRRNKTLEELQDLCHKNTTYYWSRLRKPQKREMLVLYKQEKKAVEKDLISKIKTLNEKKKELEKEREATNKEKEVLIFNLN